MGSAAATIAPVFAPVRDTWQDVQTWGRVRARVRGGRTSYWIDLRPLARIWTTPQGDQFRTREHAEGVLSDIRRLVWKDGKPREAAISYYLSRSNPRRRLDYAYGLWITKMREGKRSKEYVDHLAYYATPAHEWRGRIAGGYLDSIAGLHYQTVNFGHLEDLECELLGRGLSDKTRAHVFGALHVFFRWMKRRQMIDSVPDFPVVSVPKTIGPILLPEQQADVLGEIPENARAIFLALAFHGLRPSEAARLDTPADYDWREGVARLPGPKAKTGEPAMIPFGAELRALLDTMPAAQRIDGGPLFRNPRGKNADRRWRLDALERVWAGACKRVGVSCPLYRGTKHSSATAARRRGVPLDQIKEALRHADIRSTEKYAQAAELVPVSTLTPIRGKS